MHPVGHAVAVRSSEVGALAPPSSGGRPSPTHCGMSRVCYSLQGVGGEAPWRPGASRCGCVEGLRTSEPGSGLGEFAEGCAWTDAVGRQGELREEQDEAGSSWAPNSGHWPGVIGGFCGLDTAFASRLCSHVIVQWSRVSLDLLWSQSGRVRCRRAVKSLTSSRTPSGRQAWRGLVSRTAAVARKGLTDVVQGTEELRGLTLFM